MTIAVDLGRKAAKQIKTKTERAPRDENGNATLMAQGAKQEFILHITT